MMMPELRKNAQKVVRKYGVQINTATLVLSPEYEATLLVPTGPHTYLSYAPCTKNASSDDTSVKPSFFRHGIRTFSRYRCHEYTELGVAWLTCMFCTLRRDRPCWRIILRTCSMLYCIPVAFLMSSRPVMTSVLLYSTDRSIMAAIFFRMWSPIPTNQARISIHNYDFHA